MTASIPTMLRACALGAAALVLAMLGLFLVTGIGQDPLQYVHPVAEYNALLLRSPALLRAAIGLDNAFIVLYSAVFVLLFTALWQRGVLRPLPVVALVLLLGVGLLDMLENMHFLAMLSAAEQGRPPLDAQIVWQASESMVKFQLSYVGLFLLGCALPRDSAAWRALGRLLLWVQWPVGITIYVVPHGLAVPLVLVRFGFFLASFLLLAWIHRQPGIASRVSAGPVAAVRGASGSGVPA